MKPNSSALESSSKTLPRAVWLRSLSAVPCLSHPQQRRDTEGQPQGHGGTAAGHGAAYSSSLQGNAQQPPPPEPPFQRSVRAEEAFPQHLRARAPAGESRSRRELLRARNEASEEEPQHLGSLYPRPRRRAGFCVRSGHRSAWGDKAQPRSRQWSCAPGVGTMAGIPWREHSRVLLLRRYLLAPFNQSRLGTPVDLQGSLVCS